jgi:phage terminase small subunit
VTEETEDKPLPKLQRRHKLFCDHYLTGMTGSDAYRQIEPDAGQGRARDGAYRILKRPEVKAYLAERRKDLSEATGVRAEQIVRELSMVGFSNIKKLYNEDGSIIPVHLLPDEVAASLSGIDVEALYEGSGKDRIRVGDILKFKAWPKVDALEKLAKILGFMVEKVEVTDEQPPIIQLVAYPEDATEDPVPSKPPAT